MLFNKKPPLEQSSGGFLLVVTALQHGSPIAPARMYRYAFAASK
jgi:hypothetical protein